MVKKVSKPLVRQVKSLHKRPMESLNQPATLQFLKAFLRVVDDFQAEFGVNESALCKSVITGYDDDGNPISLSRLTLRKMREYDGVKAAPNWSTAYMIESFIATSYHENLENSLIIYKSKMAEALAELGFGDGKYRPPRM